MKNRIHTFLGILFITSILFTSCSDDDNDNTDQIPTGDVTTDDQFAEFEAATRKINDLMQESFNTQSVANSTPKLSAKMPDCGATTVEEIGTNKVITINFGADCTLDSKDIVSGIMRISFNLDALAGNNIEINYTLEDFKFNDIIVNGNAISRFSTNETNPNFSFVTTSNYTFTWSDTISAVTETNLTFEFVFGNDTGGPVDFEFYSQTSGTSTAKFSNNDQYSTEITTPLRINNSCTYIVSGVVVNNSNSKKSTLDYGNGECDDKATLTDSDGNETTIDL